MASTSSSVTLWSSALRRAATWRAKGLPGPPGLPRAKRPRASWAGFGWEGAAGLAAGGVDMGCLLKGVRESGTVRRERALPLYVLLARGGRRGRSVDDVRQCQVVQSAPSR